MRKVLTAAMVVIIAAGIACDDDLPSHSDGSLLAGIPNTVIDGSAGGVKLEAAPGAPAPAISSDAAEQRALTHRAGEVLETILVSYTDLVKEPSAPVLAWAVNYDPARTPPLPPMGCRPAPCSGAALYHEVYSYSLVDAMTGEVIKNIDYSAPYNSPAH